MRVHVGKRIEGFETVNDVAVRKRRQAVEFDVSVAIPSAHKIAAIFGCIDEGAGAENWRG